MDDNDRPAESWRLSREIPITVLVAFAVQAAGVIWWAQGINKAVESNTHRIEQMEAQRTSERLTALESQIVDTRAALVRIESNLYRLMESTRETRK